MARCHLCNCDTTLIEGHIWPKFSYKYYVSKLDKGGSHIDLIALQTITKQIKRKWFCNTCDNESISKLEKYASQICRSISSHPNNAVDYNEQLLLFATSINWRFSKLCMESPDQHTAELLKKPNRRWREFLSGDRSNVSPYSQHVFIIAGDDDPWIKIIGGELFLKDRIIFSKVGPLLIVGLLSREQLSLKEIEIFEKSEIDPMKGILYPVKNWEVDKTIPQRLVNVLKRVEDRLINGVKQRKKRQS